MTALEGPDYQLQVQVVAVLRASTDLKSLIGSNPVRLYETVPKGAAFPYCVIGESQDLPDLAECIDGSEIHFAIHIWSKGPGFKEAKQIAKVIRDALAAASITMSENRCLLMERDQTGDFYLRDPDGVTVHGIANFRAVLEPL